MWNRQMNSLAVLPQGCVDSTCFITIKSKELWLSGYPTGHHIDSLHQWYYIDQVEQSRVDYHSGELGKACAIQGMRYKSEEESGAYNI